MVADLIKESVLCELSYAGDLVLMIENNDFS